MSRRLRRRRTIILLGGKHAGVGHVNGGGDGKRAADAEAEEHESFERSSLALHGVRVVKGLVVLEAAVGTAAAAGLGASSLVLALRRPQVVGGAHGRSMRGGCPWSSRWRRIRHLSFVRATNPCNGLPSLPVFSKTEGARPAPHKFNACKRKARRLASPHASPAKRVASSIRQSIAHSFTTCSSH